MSPILYVAATFALSPIGPSIALDPDSAGQSASVMSQHVLGTGGFVFAMVAIVSVAGYFYHGRGAAKSARTSNTWASWSSFLSSMRHRGTAATSKAAANDWPVDVEVGPEHVSMVYARFFHPTFWNLAGCHPAMGSAPAIYVEDEAKEKLVSEPKRFGMNSLLDMDGDGDGSAKPARKNADQDAKPRVEQLPPFDTRLATNVNFRSEIIGTTERPGGFLPGPGERGEYLLETSSSDSELDLICSPYDRNLTTPPGSSDDARETWSSDSKLDMTCLPYHGILTTPPGTSDELDLTCSAYERILTTPPGSCEELDFTGSPYDGILTTPPRSSDDVLEISSPDSGLDLTCSPYDGILTTPPGSSDELDLSCEPYDGILMMTSRLSPALRRYGMADMEDLAQTLDATIPEPGYNLVPTNSPRSGLCDLSELVDADSAVSCRPVDRCESVDDKSKTRSGDIDIGAHDSRGGLRKNSSDAGPFAALHEGLDLMRRLLEELRDPYMDCTSRALPEDSDFECDEDDEDQRSVPPLTPTRGIDSTRRISIESSSSPPRTDSDLSDEGPIYPMTPPARTTTPLLSTPDIDKVRMPSPVTTWLNDEVKDVLPTSLDSPLALPCRAYVRTQMEHRFLVRGRTSLPYLA